MYSLKTCILLAAVAHGATIQERAVVPFRAPKIPERPDFVSPGSGGVHIGSGASDAGAWAGIAAGGRGTAPESTTPFQPGFYERNKELIEKAVEAAGEVFDVLQDVIDLAGGGDDNDDEDDTGNWQSTMTLPPSTRPTRVASTSDGASNSTANYVISQNNVTYTFFSDPRLMSKDVVAEMANSSFNRLSRYQDLFTLREYDMFLKDPICFYANIESMYLNASSSVVAEASASITPSPTQSLERRQTTDGEGTSCEDFNIPGISQVCTAVPGSPQWTSSQASEISLLWASALPDQLWSAHFATPTAASAEVTATATSTTSCVGLDGGDGPVTRYRELQTRSMDAEETSGAGDGGNGAAITPANESVSAGVEIGAGSLLTYVMGGAAVIAAVVL
ncbi:hypothetical protein MBLNU13_g08798t1 [Cladosporium sp. NU13]